MVIGGGIAGPVAALALRKAGIEATVYEAYNGLADAAGGALMVAPNGLAAFRTVGIDEALLAVGQPIRRQVMSYGTGRRLGEIPALGGLPPSLAMFRADLCRVINEQAVSQGVPVEFGKRLVSVVETADGVIARFADGSSASADLLIGADGIRSTVRTLIDPDAPGPEHAGLLSFGGIAPKNGTPASADADAMHFVLGRRAFFGYWTALDGRTLWFSNLPHPEPMTSAEAREIPSAEWLRQLVDVYADDATPGREVVACTDPDDLIVLGSMEAMPPVPHWYRGRMVLVGDSAHAPSSSSGQGVSLTAESAIELARCLRDLPDLPAAFAAYERLRRGRVEKIAATAAKTNNQKSGGLVARTLVSLIAPVAMKTFLTPEKMFGPVHRHQINWDQPVAG
jgi:2-polyprenyl-6-methoxyphenol hydroxylase-like FAD-dependent oxidoreductase